MTSKTILWQRLRMVAVILLSFGWLAEKCLYADINVTDYGAQGDLLTLTNVSVVVNSTEVICPSANFVATDVNKLIEVWNAGTFRSVSNETLVAVITAVSSPTDITISVPAGTTADGLTGVYGTDNKPAFNNAVAAAAVPVDNIIIPAGNYLLIETNINSFWNAGIIIRRGGLTFAGQGNAILTGQGGWRDTSTTTTQGASPKGTRGTLILMLSPMLYDYPLTFVNLTFDGGTYGYEGGGNNGPSTTTGEGWDMSHHAIAFWSLDGSVIFPSVNNIYNCTFHGWRGETIISGLGIQGGFMTASNCVFYDGNATAFNMNMAHDWNSCTISNYQQVEEFYRSYTTNASNIRNCLFTNILGSCALALNGGYFNNPLYTISNNIFSTLGASSFLLTSPACNVMVVSNLIYGGSVAIGFGSTGYQDENNICNSDISVIYNDFENSSVGIGVLGNGANYAKNCYISSNLFHNVSMMASGYGCSTNILFTGNYANYANHLAFDGLALSGQYFVDNGNTYPIRDYGVYPISSEITYASGSQAVLGPASAVTNYLDDNSGKLFSGASLTVMNPSATLNRYLYLNSTMTGTPYMLPPQSTVSFYWNNGWSTNAAVGNLNLLTVNSGTGSGSYTIGQVVSVFADNITGKIFKQWSGDINILANPLAASTTATIPNGGGNITATYSPSPPSNLHPLF